MASPFAVCASVPLAARPTVLVVDDDPAFLHVLPATLMRAFSDAVVEPCSSAREAASKLAQGHYDAAITDFMMPELDGLSLISHTLEARPCTKILLLTGQKDGALAERAFEQGAFDFLTKPLDRDRLVRSLDVAIKAHRLRRRIEERRLYLTQLQEVLERRWEAPLSSQAAAAVEPSRLQMRASFDQMEAAARQSERLIERAERLLERRQYDIRQEARRRLSHTR